MKTARTEATKESAAEAVVTNYLSPEERAGIKHVYTGQFRRIEVISGMTMVSCTREERKDLFQEMNEVCRVR